MSATLPTATDLRARSAELDNDANASSSRLPGVSWGAIFAGAAAAAALSLILLVLGTGLGLSSVSPWSDRGIDATALGVSAIVWLTLTQVAASGMGGYLAGRLRTKWVAVQTDEVYFRDTAHGFLAWAVATLLTASVLTTAVGSVLGTGTQAGATLGGTTMAAATGAIAANDELPSSGSGMGMGYFVDSLFRTDTSAPSVRTEPDNDASGSSSNSEVARIFGNGLWTGKMSPEDTRYVGQIIAQRTGLPQADAEKRAADTFAKVQAKLEDAKTAARDAADKARKASAGAALWLFVSLLCGAFVASLAATYGGRRRDL